jgi:hypothetical protein
MIVGSLTPGGWTFTSCIEHGSHFGRCWRLDKTIQHDWVGRKLRTWVLFHSFISTYSFTISTISIGSLDRKSHTSHGSDSFFRDSPSNLLIAKALRIAGMSIKNQSPIPSLLNFDFASEMELWNTLEYYCGTHKAHKYENKWREGWTERTLLFILVDGRVISQVGKRADPDFLQKVYSIVEVQHVWNWLSTCWHWKDTKKQGVLPSLS